MENFFEKIDNSEKLKNNEAVLRGIMDLMEKEYFSLLDAIEKLEAEEKKKLEEVAEIDISETKKFIDEKMPKLLEKVNETARNGKVDIIQGNSLLDVMKNSVIGGISAVKEVIEGIKNKTITNRGDLKDSWKKMLVIFQNVFDYGVYYLDEICLDEIKLEMELSRVNGYLEKFRQYFNEIESKINEEMKVEKKFPTGSRKVSYFVFFSKLEKGEFEKDEVERELEKLDESYLNKKKLMADIKSGEFWKTY
ncbi:MAG: hypothetical protein ACD_11C00017G0014 [uncultured bacterium]|nr:MAG: hypothetical protein ACD_11C00017G0014 [uncultured bacterium]HBR71503.1 hypothetical protein [Candidatus Moranbacteria bacterium]